jgi:hypothetical protein
MKRDWNLIRVLLLDIESTKPTEGRQHIALPEGFDGDDVMGHLKLLFDAGFIDGEFNSVEPPMFYIAGLTWSGHDFLDSIRCKSVLGRALSRGAKAGVS